MNPKIVDFGEDPWSVVVAGSLGCAELGRDSGDLLHCQGLAFESLIELDRDTLHTRFDSSHECHSGDGRCAFALVSCMRLDLLSTDWIVWRYSYRFVYRKNSFVYGGFVGVPGERDSYRTESWSFDGGAELFDDKEKLHRNCCAKAAAAAAAATFRTTSGLGDEWSEQRRCAAAAASSSSSSFFFFGTTSELEDEWSEQTARPKPRGTAHRSNSSSRSDSSSQESDKVDPAIKEGNKKSEEGKKGLKPSTKHPIDNTAADNPTKEKEQQVKDVSSEKRGHDKSADRISLQEGKPMYEHAHEVAATAATAASSKPSSVQKKETVGPQANPRRTDQEERRVSTMEPTREAAAEHSQFSSVDGIGSQANPGRINQDQGRRVSTKGPGEAMYYRFPIASGVRSEASPIPRKEDQPRRNSQIY
uniref:Uncharacterized protein n=1 Tax=Ananas comosus var. bracteatus TaxID=296719 RepID=A0A6V7NVX1_ANACO|nr:unnamed protein product [Ananas comosus var. bracteatus]